MIVYPDVIMPRCVIEAGVDGKQIRMNDRVQTQGGFDSINVIWNNTLREFNVGFKPMLPSAWSEMEGLFEITDAGAFGFLMEDPKDKIIAEGDGFMQSVSLGQNVGTMGQGFGVPSMQLYKRYRAQSTTRTKNRKITRPKNTTIFRRNGTPIIVGPSAGNISVDYNTGLITFVPDVFGVIASITTGAGTVLTFSPGSTVYTQLAVGQRVFITSVAGTNASTLNGQSHLISAKNANTLTLSTPTTGTLTGGTAFKYPQATDLITASGEFYVPVHFAADTLDWDILRPGVEQEDRLVQGVGIRLMEIRE